MTMVGVVFGLVPVAGDAGPVLGRPSHRPLRPPPGDHPRLVHGRRLVRRLRLRAAVWQVALLVAVESAFGWPLFQTASNAMIADIVVPEQRQEAYSINRVAMNLGVVIGPAAGGTGARPGAPASASSSSPPPPDAPLRWRITLVWIRESRPASAATAGPTRRQGPQRLPHRVRRPRVHRVLPGRRAAGVLHRQLRLDLLGLHPVVPARPLRRVGHAAGPQRASSSPPCSTRWCAPPGSRTAWSCSRSPARSWPSASAAPPSPGRCGRCVLLIVIMSLGETLLSPVASAEVSDLAPEALRGRYMGVWTVVWNGGRRPGARLRRLGHGPRRRAPGLRAPAGDRHGRAGAVAAGRPGRAGAGRRTRPPGAALAARRRGRLPVARLAAAPAADATARARSAGRGRAPLRR